MKHSRTEEDKPQKCNQQLDRKRIRVLRSMNFNFAILKPDKGSGIVVVERSDYIFSVHSLLDNPHIFKKVFTDPTSTRLTSIQTYLFTCFKRGEISDDEFKFLAT